MSFMGAIRFRYFAQLYGQQRPDALLHDVSSARPCQAGGQPADRRRQNGLLHAAGEAARADPGVG